ncbi:MAG: Smr/MutS family protein [Chitinophagaceae bacterium]|nr:Smr/MutS family protein [Chitinophagaceae bacterium]
MKYQIGDIVLILHSNEEGRVVDIINDKMLMVDVNGVSFPVYMDQVDFPYFKRFTEKKLFPAKKEKQFVDDIRKEKPSPEKRVADGVWLTFLPVMDTDEFGDVVVEELKIHLINRTETPYNFVYKLHFFGKPDFELKNTIQPFEDFYLHDVDFSDMNDSPSFEFDFSLLQPDNKPAHRGGKALHYESSVKLKPKQLFAKIEELKEKNQAHFSLLLFSEYPGKAIEDNFESDNYQLDHSRKKGNKLYNAGDARLHLEPPRTVVDLHIEKLTDNYKHMSNYEIVSLQLKTFEKYFHLAVAHHQHSLIVIHGVGEGVLRDEIHDILRLKKEVKSFVNQHHPNFGYGATEIFFKAL